MKTRILSLMIIFTICTFLFSCSKKTTVTTVIPVTPATPVTPLITLPAGWKLSTTFGTSFPTGIQVYQFDTIFLGKTVKAFCVAYDSKNTTLEFKPTMATVATTPSTFSANETGIVYACINGGYFGARTLEKIRKN